MNKINIYTDGSSSTKTLCGGWAFVVLENDIIIKTESGGEKFTTNNRMEMVAFLSALNFIEKDNNINYEIFSDSSYLISCFQDKWYLKWISNGWINSDKKPVKNKEIWELILKSYNNIISNKNKILTLTKIKSHSGLKWNDYVDLLSRREKEKLENKENC